MFAQYLKHAAILLATVSSIYTSSDTHQDEKSLYVTRASSTFCEEITQQKSKLKTSSDAIALLSLAIDRMQNIGILPTDPSWELITAYTLQGKGFALIPFSANSPFNKILAAAHCLSASRLESLGTPENYDDLNIDGLTPNEVNQYKQFLSQSLSTITPELRQESQEYLAQLTHLRTITVSNCWYLNEHSWAQAGVISPSTAPSLQSRYNPSTPPLEFLSRLVDELSAQINGLTASTATSQKTQSMVDLSRQILFTITAGIPTSDTHFVRLSPQNEKEWELVRKALFTALSACDIQDSDITYLLSRTYDLGKYYPAASSPQNEKEYFWKIEAYAELYAKIHHELRKKSDESLSHILKDTTDESDYFKHHRAALQKLGLQAQVNFNPGTDIKIRRKTFESLTNETSLQSWKTEIEALSQRTAHLNHKQAFQDLYSHLTPWVHYHNASEHIPSDVLTSTTALNHPTTQTIQTLEITLQNGKWVIKTGGSSESILWQQKSTTSEHFHGHLKDKRGSHFFSFDVTPQSLTIRAISTGYKLKLGHESAHVSLSNNQYLSVVESSAYPSSTISIPTDADISKNPNSILTMINGTGRPQDAAIQITSKTFNGSHGLIIARRGSIWIEATDSIRLANESNPQTKTHNGRPYNFFKNEGNGIEALKDISLFCPDMNLKFAKLVASGNIALRETPLPSYIARNHQCLQTSGAYINAGLALDIDYSVWHGDTQTVFSGNVEQPSYLVFNSDQANLNYRHLRYLVWNLCFFDEAEKKLLANTPNSHGAFNSVVQCKPHFSTQIIVIPAQVTISSGSWAYKPFNH